jgi:preprotein translocase subunit SecE
MSKEREVAVRAYWQEIFRVGLYKKNQGLRARQATFFAIAIMVCFVAGSVIWGGSLGFLTGLFSGGPFIVGILVAFAGFWLAYRLVNFSQFADFLIAVEAEMNKVSWPSQGELIRAVVVVITVIITLAVVLFAFDMVWRFLFQVLGIVYAS